VLSRCPLTVAGPRKYRIGRTGLVPAPADCGLACPAAGLPAGPIVLAAAGLTWHRSARLSRIAF